MRGGMRGNACSLLRRHPARADGPLDAAAQRARRALLLDLRRPLRDRQLRPPGADRQGVRLRGRRDASSSASRRSTPTTTWPRRRPRSRRCRRSTAILFYDTAGVLEVERLRTLLPQIVAAAGGQAGRVPLEQPDGHVGPDVRRGGASTGCKILHTATPLDGQRPVGPVDRERRPQPRADGLHALDRHVAAGAGRGALPRASARPPGYLVDQVSEYDLFNVTHQVPGGMLGTLTRAARAARHDRPHRRGPGRDRRGARATSAGR